MSFKNVGSSQGSLSKKMSGGVKVSLLALSLPALALLVACGSSNNQFGVGCRGTTGSFSNASLPANSQWAYELSGDIANTTGGSMPYAEAGVFTSNGNGGITAWIDDFYGGTFTNGSYTISPNGTGQITINFSGGQVNLAITMTGTASFYLIEADNFANASGTAFQQDTTAFAAPPNGTFVFRTHLTTGGSSITNASVASVGVMTVNSSGVVTGMNEDVLMGGSNTSQRTLGATGGSFTTPDSTGRGTFTYSDSAGRTVSYTYYVLNASTYLLYDSVSALALGRIEAQSGGPFSNSTLAANSGFVFGSHGDTALTAAGGVNSAGQFVVDGGVGNITSGSYDSVQDGTATSNAALVTGSTYAADASGDGRYAVTLNANGVVVQDVFYMVSPNRGFFLVNDSTKVEDGTADLQTTSSFSNSNVNGQFGFGMGGLDFTPEFVDRSGVIVADGNGNLTAAYVLNVFGVVTSPGCLSGTYTNGSNSNGRFQGNFGSSSGVDLVFYMTGTGQGYVIQEDTNVEIWGGMATQSVVPPVLPGGF